MRSYAILSLPTNYQLVTDLGGVTRSGHAALSAQSATGLGDTPPGRCTGSRPMTETNALTLLYSNVKSVHVWTKESRSFNLTIN